MAESTAAQIIEQKRRLAREQQKLKEEQQQADHQLKVKDFLLKSNLARQRQQQAQQEQAFDAQSQQAQFQAQTQLSQAQLQVQQELAKRKAQAKAQELQMKAGAEQQQLAQEQAQEPILGPQPPVDGTQPNMDTMPQVSAQGLSVAQPPGMPTQGGGGQSPYGPLAPYLEQQTTRQSLMRTSTGAAPITEVTTRRAPNVLTAYQAASLEADRRTQAAARDDAYWKGIVETAVVGGSDSPAFKEESARWAPEDQLRFKQAYAMYAGEVTASGAKSAKQVLGPQGRSVWEQPWNAIGMPTGAENRAAAGRTSVTINNNPLMPTNTERTNLQEGMHQQLETIAVVDALDASLKPEHMERLTQGEERVRSGLRSWIPGFVGEEDPAAQENTAEYRTTNALIATVTGEGFHKMAGSALTPLEFIVHAPRFPQPGEDYVTIKAKLASMRNISQASYIRDRFILTDGFPQAPPGTTVTPEMRAQWTASHPEYSFVDEKGTATDLGEDMVYGRLAQDIQQRSTELKQEFPDWTLERRQQEASDEVYQHYGIRTR